MSEKIKKPKLDLTKLEYVEKVPERSIKQSIFWLPTLKALIEATTKNPAKSVIQITEKQASLPAVRNQIVKAVKNNEEIAGIIVNTRTINKVETIFISYHKPQLQKK
jgi:hypothetical protein